MLIVTKNKINDNKYEVIAEVDEKVWIEAQEKARKKLYNEIEVDGFRKGHVPEEVAKNHINSEQIFDNAIKDILPTVFSEAMQKSELKPIIAPRVNINKFSTTNLTLSFTITIMPKVELNNYKNLGVKHEEVVITDEEIENAVKEVLNSNIVLKTKNDVAKNGDTVIFDFEGSVDGKTFDGGTSKNFELVLGSKQFIPGFEEQLIGLKANDKKDVIVTFPNDYHNKDLCGKKALFKCVIHEVKEQITPVFNDEMVKKLSIPNVETLEDLKKYQIENLKKNKENEINYKFYDQLIDTIIENNNINIDNEIILEETENTKKNFLDQISKSGMTLEWYLDKIKKNEKEFTKDLENHVKKDIYKNMIVNAIAEKENIVITNDDIKKEYEKLSKKYNMQIEKIKEYFSEENIINQIKNQKVYNLLIDLNK